MVYRWTSRTMWVVLVAMAMSAMGGERRVDAAASEVVLYASEASLVRGNWAAASSTTAAGGRLMRSNDYGFSSANAPQASPANYFEMSFAADAGTTYRVWLRLRAGGNSKWNDAVWVQFNDSLTTSGSAIYRIGTTSGLMVNLERCNSCGLSGWGWHNTAYWLSQSTYVRFAASGNHTVRVQTREDGVEVDQIILSPVKYVSSAPGQIINDSTVVSKTTTSSGGTSSSGSGSPTPYKGSPFSLPGTVPAADFDNGGQGVAYSDGTGGNSGSVYRQTDVDVQSASIGGYNVGWTSAGEWLKYTVNVSAAGSYNVSLRVAALSGQSVQVTIGSASQAFSVPGTGGWQSWQTVNVPMTLAAGQQMLTVKFNTGGVNLQSISVGSGSSSSGSSGSGSGSGGTFRMMTWNVHHGKNTSGSLSVPAQAQHIANQNPHVVVLQEVQTWDQNQPQMFETELERLTGANWFRQWAPVQPSQWTEGNVVLTRLPVVSSTSHQMHATGDWSALLSNRSVAQVTVTVGGLPVHVFSTHLDYGNTTYRTAQLLDLMNWLQNYSGRKVVGGDFNSTPGTYWITTMMGDFYDTWQDVTGSSSGGGTINGVRFDYLFRGHSSSDKIRPTSVRVLSSSLSDHYAVVADYTVTP
jgi:endonuclease/exonuclease/phosphatase family metal-dependent hydrolase